MMRAYWLLTRAYRAAGALCVIAMLSILIASIALREIFGIALVWANEVSIALFVWSVFLGFGTALADNLRIRFDIAVDHLPATAQRVIELVVSYVGLVLLGGFFATSVYVTWVYSGQRFTTLAASVAWEWSAVPVGTLLAVIGWLHYRALTWRGTTQVEKAKTAIPGT
jgi:TRAP-type C4-dicarboxylate transport system permease small subunit